MEAFCFYFLSIYQEGLEELMKASDFAFGSLGGWYYKCHRINLNCGGLNIDSPNWIKSKKMQQILKIMMIDVLNMQLKLHLTMKELNKSHKMLKLNLS